MRIHRAMSKNYRFLVAITLVAATSGAGGCTRAPAEPPSARVAVDAGTGGAALDRRTRGWQLAKWYGYELKLTTAVSFGDRENAVAFRLDGLVQLTPTAVTREEVTLYLAVTSPKSTKWLPRSATPASSSPCPADGSTTCARRAGSLRQSPTCTARSAPRFSSRERWTRPSTTL